MIKGFLSDRRLTFFDFHRLLPKRDCKRPLPEPSEEVIKNGQAIAICNGSATVIEQWVKKVGRITGTNLDWAYLAGHACIYCLGDTSLQQKALAELQKTVPSTHKIRITDVTREKIALAELQKTVPSTHKIRITDVTREKMVTSCLLCR